MKMTAKMMMTAMKRNMMRKRTMTNRVKETRKQSEEEGMD